MKKSNKYRIFCLVPCFILASCFWISENDVREKLPDTFTISESLFFKNQISCIVGVFKVELAKTSKHDLKKFTAFYKDSSFEQLIEDKSFDTLGERYSTELGITALSGKSCFINGSNLKQKYLDNLKRFNNWISVSAGGDEFVVYNPEEKIIFFVSKD